MSLLDRRYAGANDLEAERRAARAVRFGGAIWRRLGFLAACAFAASAVVVFAGSNAGESADPGLANLLKGMAIIKTVILCCGGAAIWWRLGSPISAGLAAGYIFSAAIATAGAALVWSMTGLALAPFFFDGGLLAFLVLALRDDNGPWLRSLTRAGARRSDPKA
jgi:hypothetical protein